MSQILVAFATKNGSTEEVAAAIAGGLRDSGCDVHLRCARDVTKPVAGWDLVVLGAPIYRPSPRGRRHLILRRTLSFADPGKQFTSQCASAS